MRTFSIVFASGMSPKHYGTQLQARADLIRAGDPSGFVAVLVDADHAVLALDGARELALRLLSKAAAVECPFHNANPGVPCAPGPARICPRRMEAAGFIPYVNGRAAQLPIGDRLDAPYPLEPTHGNHTPMETLDIGRQA